MNRHIVSVSSGVGSAYAWKLVCDRFGAENVTGVFTDVNGEHPDNYRFLAEVQYEVGSRLVKIGNDGRNIWDVMIERRFLANTRVDVCSRVLKREAFQDWLRASADPADCVIYLGIDWTEMHRLDRARPLWADAGYRVEAPMCEPPYHHKTDSARWLAAAGIRRPALYDLGFEHANCGGGCVKAGVGQFRKLLFADRKWYMWWENGEQRVRDHLGKDVSILRDRSRDGIMRRLGLSERDIRRAPVAQLDDCGAPLYHEVVRATGRKLPAMVTLTLRDLRLRLDAQPDLFSTAPDSASCGACFLAPAA